MIDLSASLSRFSQISLEEMDHVKLLDRIDTKFVIHEDKLAKLLDEISGSYDLLVIEDKWIHPYETLYFDTPGFNLYQMHQNGKRNRYKLRYRKYVNSGISFFEIKTKSNTDRTSKQRIPVDGIPEAINEPVNQFIRENIPGDYQTYVPALSVFFDRITLVNKLANERLTMDVNLRYKKGDIESKIEKIVIVEVKQEKHSLSPFRQLMKLHRLRKLYVSKYCLGISRMNSGLKRNRFKQKFAYLNKLGYDIH